MATIDIPANMSILLVNVSSAPKTFRLPAISSFPGRMFIFKDIFGAAGNSSIFLSTTGADIIERSTATTTRLSTSYGAWTFINDGRTTWFLTDIYANTMLVSSIAAAVPVVSYSPLSASPALWLDANDYSTFTFSSGTNISAWADKSGNTRHATGVSSPVYSSGSVYLSGSSYFTVNLDFIASYPDHSAFIVMTNTNYVNIYGAQYGGNGSSSLHVGFSATNAYRVNHWGNDWYPNTTAAYKSGQRNLLNFDWINTGGLGKAVRANANVEGTIGQTGQITSMYGGGTIGNVVGQGILTGYINEIIFILNPNITSTIRSQLEGYLAWKWGIQANLPSGHPYYSAAP
jgi:hypothetical protein